MTNNMTFELLPEQVIALESHLAATFLYKKPGKVWGTLAITVGGGVAVAVNEWLRDHGYAPQRCWGCANCLKVQQAQKVVLAAVGKGVVGSLNIADDARIIWNDALQDWPCEFFPAGYTQTTGAEGDAR